MLSALITSSDLVAISYMCDKFGADGVTECLEEVHCLKEEDDTNFLYLSELIYVDKDVEDKKKNFSIIQG